MTVGANIFRVTETEPESCGRQEDAVAVFSGNLVSVSFPFPVAVFHQFVPLFDGGYFDILSSCGSIPGKVVAVLFGRFCTDIAVSPFDGKSKVDVFAGFVVHFLSSICCVFVIGHGFIGLKSPKIQV